MPAMPEMDVLCVDAAGVVWALPKASPNAEARSVGWAVRRRSKWGYETEAHGGSKDVYGSPRAAAEALVRVLDGRERAA